MADPSGNQGSRASNALQKRQDSLRRWKGSETDRQPVDRSRKKPKIQFNSGIVFLSAVSSGDVDEVKKLLAKGADINYQNVDGLTALHQACIDENFDLVKVLVDKGASMDVRDNEGWTSLHAAASCGSVEIAKYLIENGADVAAVNNEGELPLDLAEEEDMEDLLTDEIENQGIDVDDARAVEEKIMLNDAQSWLNKNCINESKDKTEASALHVASSKGYLKVIGLLLQLGVEINAKDADNWTPLHAAAHWGQKDACELLSENGADFNARNKMGQTPIDLAEPDMVKFLEDLKKRQNDKPKIKPISPLIKTNLETSGPPPLKRSPTGCKDPTYNSTDYDIEGLMSSITRIKDQNLFLRDINQERMQLEASREKDGPAPTKPRLGYVKVPSFAESPKEDKEKERAFSYNKDESESETESETESSTEESSSEEEQKPPPRTTPVRKTAVNSIPAKPSQQRAQLKSESTGSESETETSSEEEAAPTKTPPSTVNSRTPVTRAQSTPSLSSSVTSPTSRQPVTTGGSRALKSPFLDQDKKGPASPTTPTTPSRTFGSRFADREEKKEPSSQFGFPTRTTAATTTTNSTTSSIRDRFGSRSSATTTTATTDSTTSSVRDRLGSRSSQDEKEPPSSAGGRKARKVTKRAGTAFVGSIDNDDEEEEEEEEKSNDLDSAKTTEPTSHAGTTDRTSRTRLGATSADRDKKEPEADTFTTRRSRLQDQNKENEEGEVSSWRRKRLEREREREKEKEKAEVPSYRRNRFQDAEKEREQRKAEDDSTAEARAAKRNTKVNEERPSYRRSRLPERGDTESSASDRSKGSRGTDTTARDTRQAPATVTAQTNIQVTETDPIKLREKLQEALIEVQQYKVKLEQAMQDKEKLERKLSSFSEDMKQINDLKAENQRLKDENGALIRVISKLSKPPS
ncbi:protein phosphatase 1 regulatory subunit 12A isoform X4 [Nematostella vectensis]|uniref:protein phosphatase 1 regulatory subunit 12A isoform X4 n=1 Tax=Nematostella vectensis TaxID=45351 RepID=UPI002076F6DD|nr:protein phosphatase 1 regulatory subunit 12A isoform X4 [Nematostella vectensis]